MSRRNSLYLLTVVVITILAAGCGGGGSGSTGTPSPAPVQGAFSGTISPSGFSFDNLVLPNGVIWGVYGTSTSTNSSTGLSMSGFFTGQGSASSTGVYTANVTDFNPALGQKFSATVSTTYSPSGGLNGTFSEPTGSGTQTITGTTGFPNTNYNFNSPASLSSIAKAWPLQQGTLNINSSGTVTGNSSTCAIAGTFTPDNSNNNFFNVSLTLTGTCTAAGTLVVTGIAVDYTLSNGLTQLVVLTVNSTSDVTFTAVSTM